MFNVVIAKIKLSYSPKISKQCDIEMPGNINAIAKKSPNNKLLFKKISLGMLFNKK